MKMALVLGCSGVMVSLPGLKGHFLRTVVMGLCAGLMSSFCYSAGWSAVSVAGWGVYKFYLSPWLVVLTWFVSFLAMVVSTSKVSWNSSHSQSAFGVCIVVTAAVVSVSFLVSNLFWFYVLFEGSLIPMFYLVAGWGAYQERVEASVFMVLYTVGASLPFLMVIAYHQGSLSKAAAGVFSEQVSVLPTSVVCYSVLLAFLVKLPTYPLHLWLPKAHVEAPTAGSMILAGVMLKLGGFGLVCSLALFGGYFTWELWFISAMAVFGGLVATAHCLLQADLKSAIAYSSVAHMSLVVYGAVCMNSWGISCSFITMVSHGLTSSGLFCFTHWVYDMKGTRLLSAVSGLLVSARSLALWGLILLSANIPTPPWFSIVGEVFVVPAVLAHNSHYVLLLPLSAAMLFSAAFNLNLYGELFQGSADCFLVEGDLEKVGHLSLFGHVCPLALLVFFVDKFVF